MRKFVGARMVGAPWLIVMGLPAMVSVMERATPPFAATVNVRLPDPVRVPDGTVIHEGTPVADQEHVELVETESVLVVPVAGAVTVAGVTVTLQFPGCVTSSRLLKSDADKGEGIRQKGERFVFGAMIAVLPFPFCLLP